MALCVCLSDPRAVCVCTLRKCTHKESTVHCSLFMCVCVCLCVTVTCVPCMPSACCIRLAKAAPACVCMCACASAYVSVPRVCVCVCSCARDTHNVVHRRCNDQRQLHSPHQVQPTKRFQVQVITAKPNRHHLTRQHEESHAAQHKHDDLEPAGQGKGITCLCQRPAC